MTSTRLRALALLAVAALARPAGAAVTPAPGFLVYGIPTPGTVQGGVVRAGDVVLVGQGSFGAGAQQVIRLENGVATVIATGFNSLGGFDLGPDGVLYVTDNGGNLPGAVAGDTVHAIPDALTRTSATSAAATQVLPKGSIPFAQDVVAFSDGVLVSDGAGPGAGRIVQLRPSGTTNFATGLDYTAALAVDGSDVLVGNVDATFAGAVLRYGPTGGLLGPEATGLSGCYGVAIDQPDILVTGGFTPDFSSSTLAAITPTGVVERAHGFAFSTDLFHDTARDESLVLDAGASEVTVICPDADGNALCDFEACVGGSAIDRARVSITALNKALGQQKVQVKGDVPIPGTIDPVATGLRVTIDGARTRHFDLTLPPGAYDPDTRLGWRVKGGGRVWTFTALGTQVIVKTVPSAPGVARVSAKFTTGASVVAADLPLGAAVGVDEAGRCGTAEFPGLPGGICTLNASGASVKCR